jgi:hypothetical protein
MQHNIINMQHNIVSVHNTGARETRIGHKQTPI